MKFLLLSILIIALIALYISIKVKNRTSFDSVVSFFLLFVIFHASYTFVFEIGSFPRYIDTAFPFGVAYGPMFYVGLRAATGNALPINKASFHAVPFVIFVCLFVIFASTPESHAIYSGFYFRGLYSLVSISMIGYLMMAFFISRKRVHSKSASKTIRLIAIAVALMATMGVMFIILTVYNIIPRAVVPSHFPRYLIYTAILIQAVAVIHYQIERLLNDTHGGEIDESRLQTPEPGTQYQKSLVSESALDEYEEKLNILMMEKVFQDIDLSLEGLAKRVGAPKHHLTQLLNLRMKKNFNQYINTLRIEHACVLLKQGNVDYSIQELAYECGFNSKVSFNRNFKLIAGLTPSEYRIKHVKYSDSDVPISWEVVHLL